MRSMVNEEIKNVATEILGSVADFCDRFNLRYAIDYGTLLGGVRHGGFIPWDDDVDITMPRPDYEKFLELAKTNTIGSNLVLIHDKASGGINAYAKIGDVRTIAYPAGRLKKYSLPVWVDIFPVDGCPKDEAVLKRQVQRIQFIDHVRCETYSLNVQNQAMRVSKRIAKFFLMKFMTPYPFARILDKMASKYDFNQSDRIMNFLSPYGIKDIMPQSYYDDAVDMNFEGIKVKAPKEYHVRLQNLYGDYLKLPPPEERISHSLDAYWLELQ